MEAPDELQGLWQSQPDPGLSGPRFDTLEEMTAPVQFPLSGTGKAATAGAFLAPAIVAGRGLARELSSMEAAACWLSIAAAAVGALLILRQREQWPTQSLALMEHRQAVAREYLRQAAVVRRIGIPTVLLSYGWLTVHSLVSYRAGNWSWLDPVSQFVFAVMIVLAILWQKKLEVRSVRRILRGA